MSLLNEIEPLKQSALAELKAAKVALDRKILADIAAQDDTAFSELVKVAQNALKTKAAKA